MKLFVKIVCKFLTIFRITVMLGNSSGLENSASVCILKDFE